MDKIDDITKLVDRFMNGETTLREEQLLYDYFRGENVDESLLPMRDMFMGLADMQISSADGVLNPEVQLPEYSTAKHQHFIHQYLSMGIAAAVACLLISSAVIYSYHQQNYCEVYIYGKKVTDKSVVMEEVDHTMNSMVKSTPDVDNELKIAFDE
jgi:hypothetical protein